VSGEEQQTEQQHEPPPRPVARASMHWDVPDSSPSPTSAPVAAASVLARLSGEKSRARLQSLRLSVTRAGSIGVTAAIAAAVFYPFAPSLTTFLLVIAIAFLVGSAASMLWLTRARYGYSAAARELRRRAHQEQRVATALEPLESAGWVLLHDRLVAAHRVPHVLVGPPGVVLIYPYSPSAHPRLRYQLRRARALTHSLLEWVISLPAAVVLRRRLPHLSATTAPGNVEPAPAAQDTAAWARDELFDRLQTHPDLDSWTVTVYAYYAGLDRPPDRTVLTSHGLGYHDTGTAMCLALETPSPPASTAPPPRSSPPPSTKPAHRPNGRAPSCETASPR